jgi:hypothetical protein
MFRKRPFECRALARTAFADYGKTDAWPAVVSRKRLARIFPRKSSEDQTLDLSVNLFVAFRRNVRGAELVSGIADARVSSSERNARREANGSIVVLSVIGSVLDRPGVVARDAPANR